MANLTLTYNRLIILINLQHIVEIVGWISFICAELADSSSISSQAEGTLSNIIFTI